MNIFNNKVKLAISVSTFLAYNATKKNPISSKVISKHYNFMGRTLEPILQKLTKANILINVRGNIGGYYIKDDSISLKRIVEYFSANRRDIEFKYSDEIEHIIDKSTSTLLNQLNKYTLKDLCKKLEENNVPKFSEHCFDFII